MAGISTAARKPGFWYAVIALFFAVIVVGLGAWTRLVHAGLGCPDWPGCYGFLTVPETPEKIAIAEQRYPDAPVEVDKGWPEMIHRYAAGILLLMVAGLAVNSIRQRTNSTSGENQNLPFKLPLFLLTLIILQAAFGMWTVTLKLWPQVVTAHLLGGFATLSLLALLVLRLSGDWQPVPKVFANRFAPKKLVTVALLVVIAQISLGGWTSANYAALACPDFPTCQGQVWPPMDVAEGFNITQSIGPNYLGGKMDNDARVAVHMAHRIGALITTLLVGFIAITGLLKGEMRVKPIYGFVLAALALQVILGISNVVLYLPLHVAVAHNLGGALFLISLVMLSYLLRFEKVGSR